MSPFLLNLSWMPWTREPLLEAFLIGCSHVHIVMLLFSLWWKGSFHCSPALLLLYLLKSLEMRLFWAGEIILLADLFLCVYFYWSIIKLDLFSWSNWLNRLIFGLVRVSVSRLWIVVHHLEACVGELSCKFRTTARCTISSTCKAWWRTLPKTWWSTLPEAPVWLGWQRALIHLLLLWKSIVCRGCWWLKSTSWSSACNIPIGIEHHEIIILRHILLHTIMLATELNELLAWTIIAQLLWPDFLFLKHLLKQSSSMPTSLHWFVYIEIKDAEWFYLFDCSASAIDKQISLADL